MARKSLEKYPGQRQKEKREFWWRYRFRVIEDLYKQRFFALFGNRCFRCGTIETYRMGEVGVPVLCIDHHIPMALGGHLEAGNLVALCRTCNGQKRDANPLVFYTTDELERLKPILAAQPALFDFSFDLEKWEMDREAYLLEVGVDPAVVQAALSDENFVGYIEPAADHDLRITISIEERSIEDVTMPPGALGC